jgi:hypothetical protein
MRWASAVAVVAWATACQGSDHGADDCAPACGADQVCRYGACVAPPIACPGSAGCPGDQHCDTTRMECLPWGVGPGGDHDASCGDSSAPGVYFPGVQCAWQGPPAGDGFPDHVNVLATPMVATLAPGGTPSIVFASYNFTDHAGESCIGVDPRYYGVIRVIDGRTCEQQATIASPSVVGAAPVAIGDLGGADATPEIVAARSQGGLVAFTSTPRGWEVLWQTASTFADGLCDWAGPAIHDLDDDGRPEVIFYGAVYDGQTGATIDESIAATVDAVGVGYIPVVADVDGDGAPELITGAQLYSWDKVGRHWTPKRGLPGANGQVAVGDFGAFPQTGQDDRTRTDGVAEIALVFQGVVHVFNVFGREVFTASLRGIGGPAGQGGPPVIADFDGDGRLEIGVAGATAYNVLDPDCRGTPDPAVCASRASDGVLWAVASRGGATDLPPLATLASNRLTGSAVFDFDGDGRAEVVHGDECFTRIYDGATGKVLASRPRTSCTWYENPVIADTDGDFHAEIVTTSNRSCAITCPAVDPMFDGAACVDDTDCPGATHCGRDQRDDALGRCRCTADADCGEGYACSAPSTGPAPAGKVCRAAHPAAAMTGVRVLADTVDRWGGARPIWNQHAYSVTNVDPAGKVPRTSQWPRNWTQIGLNNFRENAAGGPVLPHTRPDLTVKQAQVACDASGPTVVAEVCNRGAAPVAPGVPVAVYTATTPSRLRCQAQTTEALAPGGCLSVRCAWTGAAGDGAVVIDDRGDGSGMARECREDNNVAQVQVSCPVGN